MYPSGHCSGVRSANRGGPFVFPLAGPFPYRSPPGEGERGTARERGRLIFPGVSPLFHDEPTARARERTRRGLLLMRGSASLKSSIYLLIFITERELSSSSFAPLLLHLRLLFLCLSFFFSLAPFFLSSPALSARTLSLSLFIFLYLSSSRLSPFGRSVSRARARAGIVERHKLASSLGDARATVPGPRLRYFCDLLRRDLEMHLMRCTPHRMHACTLAGRARATESREAEPEPESSRVESSRVATRGRASACAAAADADESVCTSTCAISS